MWNSSQTIPVPYSSGPPSSRLDPCEAAANRPSTSSSVGMARIDLGGRERVFGVHVAPPEYRLDAVHERQAAVMAQHVPEPGVHALDRIVGRRPLPAVLLLHLDEGEQRALLDEPVQAAPSLAEPLVRVGLLAVLDRVLLEERRPPGAPFVVFQQPRRGGAGVLGVLEPVGDFQELDSGLQPGLQRRAPLDLVGRVERAPLYPGVRPDGLDGGGEAGRAVGYRHLRGRDAQHERGPRGPAFALRQVPADDMAAGDRHEHRRLPAQPDAVQEHDVVQLAGGGGNRPDPPGPRRLAPERRPAGLQVRYSVLRQQPLEERRELLRPAVVLADAGCPAFGTAPSLGARLGPSVPLHLGPAGAAFWIVHAPFPSLGNFLDGKACLNRRVKCKSDTLFETPRNWRGSI